MTHGARTAAIVRGISEGVERVSQPLRLSSAFANTDSARMPPSIGTRYPPLNRIIRLARRPRKGDADPVVGDRAVAKLHRLLSQPS